jgi:hypothetical protein
MKQNLGIADRVIRLLAGIVLVELAMNDMVRGLGNTVSWLIALVLILTAMIGFCPLYAVFGIRTISTKWKAD